jgi:hypothetical protein
MAWFYSALMAWNWTVVDSSMGLRVILPACPPGAASGDGASHSINRMVRLAYLRQAARTKVTTDAIAPDVAKNSLIQIRLKADTRPFARADRGDACGICNQAQRPRPTRMARRRAALGRRPSSGAARRFAALELHEAGCQTGCMKPTANTPAKDISAVESFNQICTIRIELVDTDPLIWRVMEVLHDVVQITMGRLDSDM